ncbi:MAG: hypothetical protein COA69_09660 [Robiginitomaculum sp.]|nr:MAG: hypothetical protein COA69_09660 [Robiginitomaculum sp.]
MKHSELVAEVKELSNIAAERLKCKRKGVACSAFLSGSTRRTKLTTNGPTVGECSGEKGNCGCGHSEIKLIIMLLRHWEPKKQFTMVITHSPCTNCANAIIISGLFHTVRYGILTEHDKRGRDFLKKSGIEVGEI